MLSRFSLKTGMREYSCSRKSARSSPSVASAGMATMSGRGVITSRTSVSPKSTIDCSSGALLALDQVLLLRRLGAVASPRPRLPRRRCPRPRFSRSRRLSTISRTSVPVSGWRNRAAKSNGGSRSSSTFSGLRRTMSSGSTCSKTQDEDRHEQQQHPDRREALGAGEHREHDRGEREDQAEQQPRRHEELDRIVEVEPEAIVAAAALGHQPQRQPHQRAEGGLDRADVDGGEREEQQEGNHARRPSRARPCRRPLDQARGQAALAAQRRLDARHPAVVAAISWS